MRYKDNRLKDKKAQQKIRKNKIKGSIIILLILCAMIPSIKFEFYRNIISKNEIDNEKFSDIDEEKLTEYICSLFEININKNKNLTEDEKKLIIKSFEEYFLNFYASYMSYDDVINMCASARTIRIKDINELVKGFCWWGGSYNPITNRYSVDMDCDPETLKETVSHENVHAILKSGILSSGYMKNLFFYGVNEGMLSMLCDDVYYQNADILECLQFVVGKDTLIKTYLGRNPYGLIEELLKYGSPEEVFEFVYLLDKNVFLDYYKTFKGRIGLHVDYDKYHESELERYNRAIELFRIFYKNKYGCDISEDKFGSIVQEYINQWAELDYAINLERNWDFFIDSIDFLSTGICNINITKFIITEETIYNEKSNESYTTFNTLTMNRTFSFKNEEIMNMNVSDLNDYVHNNWPEAYGNKVSVSK